MVKVKQSFSDKSFDIINTIFLIFCLLIVAYPLLYILGVSFSDGKQVIQNKVLLFPKGFNIEAYKAIFKNDKIILGYSNSIFYVIVGTFISVSLSLLTAYPLSRKEFVGRNFFTAFIMLTILFNGGLIPLYLLVRNLGLYNSIWAIVLPNAVNVWNVIIARTFLAENIPQELYDAARIDGASDLTFFSKIVIPLSGAIVAVLCLFYAVVLWNSYFDALIFLQDQNKYPLQIILREIMLVNKSDPKMVGSATLLAQREGIGEVIRYALIVVASVPLLAIYPFVQKYFVKGVMIGSVKG